MFSTLQACKLGHGSTRGLPNCVYSTTYVYKPELCGKSVLTQLYVIEQRVGGGTHSTVLCCINDMHAGMDWVLV